MKAFYIILVTLLALIIIILSCGSYVRSFSKSTVTMLQELHFYTLSEHETQLYTLKSKVDNFLSKAEFTITRERSDTLRDYTTLLIIQAEQGNEYEFEATKALLINLLKDIAELESLKLNSLL